MNGRHRFSVEHAVQMLDLNEGAVVWVLLDAVLVVDLMSEMLVY